MDTQPPSKGHRAADSFLPLAWTTLNWNFHMPLLSARQFETVEGNVRLSQPAAAGSAASGDGSFVPSLDRSHSSGIRMLCGCLGTCCSWTHTCLAKNVYWESLGGHFTQTAGSRLARCTSALPCSQMSARNDKAQPKYIPLTSFQAIFKVFEILQFYWYHLNAMKFSRKKKVTVLEKLWVLTRWGISTVLLSLAAQGVHAVTEALQYHANRLVDASALHPPQSYRKNAVFQSHKIVYNKIKGLRILWTKFSRRKKC